MSYCESVCPGLKNILDIHVDTSHNKINLNSCHTKAKCVEVNYERYTAYNNLINAVCHTNALSPCDFHFDVKP